MRLTITPIGASGASSAAVAAAVVDYLEGARGDPGAALLGGGRAAVGYYTDSPEGPGRWSGAGASFQGLSGVVDRDAFQRVLEGRHPVTGARLVTARGSAQRQHLATGTAARVDADGGALYTVGDAARLLGMRHADVNELIDTGRTGSGEPDDRGWLASVDVDGETMVPDREISRHLELAAVMVSGASVLNGADPDELVSAAEAARLLRVTPQYVRRLCHAYLSHKPDDKDRGRAVLRCERDTTSPSAPYRIRRRDLAAFADQRRPPTARVGFDVTMTCEKSLALLAMLSDGDHQRVVLDALRTANDTAIRQLDRWAAVARRGGNRVGTEGLLAASYFHGTSRALDPHPHFHNVVANAVVDDAGDVRTLDGRALYRHAPAATALATATLRWELRHLGVAWWRRDDGVWEVAGVDEAAIRKFSRRRHEMDEVTAILEARLGRRLSHDEEDTVALSTRSAKAAVDADALLVEWRQRACDVGLDVRACFGRHHDTVVHDALPDTLVRQLFVDLVDPTRGLCAQSTTFDRGDVLAAIADWSIGDGRDRRKVLVPPAEVERLADRFLATDLVAELVPTAARGVIRRRDGSIVADGQAEPLFSTVELLTVETAVEQRFRQQRHDRAAVNPQVVEEAITGGELALSGEQADLVRAWCESGRAMQCAVGYAGAGKTTAMRVAAAAWQAAGYRVSGCAVKAEAARHLATGAGIEADTVAMLLARHVAGQPVIGERSVLVVDEASTVGTRDLAALMRLADSAGAALRLIGDPAQHASIPAGGAFVHLARLGGADTPQLRHVHRLLDPAERHRADLVRAGRISDALGKLVASGQLVLTDSDAATYAAMLTRWYEHRLSGRPHPMVHGRNRQRRLLNQLAQTILAADGAVDLDVAVTLRDGRRLAVGDEVIARHGDRSIHPPGDPDGWMRNGTTGRITAIHHNGQVKDRILVHTASGTLEVGRAVFDRRRGGVDLGYAVTSYAVQGSTRETSTSAIAASTARSELYVDITRGRHNNQLYATRQVTDPDREAHLPTIDRELIPTLRRRLATGRRPTAAGADPGALPAATLRHGRTLRNLIAERHRSNGGDAVRRAIDHTLAALRRQARSAPSPTLRVILPARPPSPHLAARWDDIAGDVAVLAALHQPARHRTRAASPLDAALGPAPDPGPSRQRWDQAAERICALAADITIWQLRHHHGVTRPAPWLRPHLSTTAAHGVLANPDLTDVASLVAAVDTWRHTHHIDPASALVLGPPPDEPNERRRYDQLQQRLVPTRPGGRSVT